MRLVVLDTNVIVSAAIQSKSAPAVLIMNWILGGRVQVVTSPHIVGESREVVQRKKFRRYGFPPIWLEFLIEESFQLPDPALWPYDGPDQGDLCFLALAHFSGAWLVTGNLKHFSKAIRNGVMVLSPADYLGFLKGSEQPPGLR